MQNCPIELNLVLRVVSRFKQNCVKCYTICSRICHTTFLLKNRHRKLTYCRWKDEQDVQGLDCESSAITYCFQFPSPPLLWLILSSHCHFQIFPSTYPSHPLSFYHFHWSHHNQFYHFHWSFPPQSQSVLPLSLILPTPITISFTTFIDPSHPNHNQSVLPFSLILPTPIISCPLPSLHSTHTWNQSVISFHSFFSSLTEPIFTHYSSHISLSPIIRSQNNVNTNERRKEMFYLLMPSLHFMYRYVPLNVW